MRLSSFDKCINVGAIVLKNGPNFPDTNNCFWTISLHIQWPSYNVIWVLVYLVMITSRIIRIKHFLAVYCDVYVNVHITELVIFDLTKLASSKISIFHVMISRNKGIGADLLKMQALIWIILINWYLLTKNICQRCTWVFDVLLLHWIAIRVSNGWKK